MKRNIYFFLDLIVQMLAVMITLAAVSSRQPVGVGLVLPGAEYMTIELECKTQDYTKPIAYSSDPNSVGVMTLRSTGATSTTVVFYARRYPTDGVKLSPLPTLRVRASLITEDTESIRYSGGDPQGVNGKLGDHLKGWATLEKINLE